MRELDRNAREELGVVLSSKLFRRAPSLAKLLSYVCRKYFDGEAAQIKEYTIAVELYKRSPDFHSKEDPIVRVEANRLRARLKEYYRTEGEGDPIRILIPSGQYVPVFQANDNSEAGREKGIQKDDFGVENQCGDNHSAGGMPPGKDVPRIRRVLYLVSFSIVALAFVIVVVISVSRSHFTPKAADAPQPPSPAEIPAPVYSLPQGPELRIMAGSKLPRYVDRLGKLWLCDQYFEGGSIVAASPTSLLRAEESHLCRLSRQGDFEYDIPLAPGIYELHLYFVEMLFGIEPEEGGETSRLFDVYANGRPLLKLFDVYSDAGGCGKMDERVFIDVSPAPDGFLHLSFRSSKSKALVNGLEILPGIPGHMRPVRITTRTSDYLSSDQRLWESDRYFSGGRSVVRLRSVETQKDPELYQSERYGNFTYTIPLAQGRYTVTLKFAETYFGLGPTNPAGSGPGMRLFDVYCSGQALLRSFDIIREAGGVNRPVDKVFHGLEPNTQGKLILSFSPVKNYACVNAIEIVPE